MWLNRRCRKCLGLVYEVSSFSATPLASYIACDHGGLQGSLDIMLKWNMERGTERAGAGCGMGSARNLARNRSGQAFPLGIVKRWRFNVGCYDNYSFNVRCRKMTPL